jgi:hypothetical protein
MKGRRNEMATKLFSETGVGVNSRAAQIFVFVLLAGILSLVHGCGGGGNGGGVNATLVLSTEFYPNPGVQPVGYVNKPFYQDVQITASAGVPPYTYSCSGSGVAGLTVSISSLVPTPDALHCIISGTPVEPGSYTVTLSASDSRQVSGSTTLTFNVNIPDPLDFWNVRADNIAVPNSKVAYGNRTFVAFPYTSSDGQSWTVRTPGISDPIFGSTYGGGQFVVVGDNGTVQTSTDGISWTARNSGTTARLVDVTYGNGMFVAIGREGLILISSDATNWESVTANTPLNAIAFGNGKFIVVGRGGTIFSSLDGKTWTSQNSGINNDLSAIAFGNINFVAVGTSGTIVTSSDGINWTAQKLAASDDLNQIVFGNGIFITTDSANILSSSDGITWSNKPLDFGLGKISAVNNVFIAFGSGPPVNTGAGRYFSYRSTDGLNWNGRYYGSVPLHDVGRTLVGAAYGNNRFVSTGSTTLTSPDGITWTIVPLADEIFNPRGVVYENGMFIIFGDKESLLTSPDGYFWTKRNLGAPAPINGVSYGNGIFVAVGDNGAVLTSSDGSIWTNRNSGTSNCLRGVTYGKSMFVAVGDLGVILTSTDGITWTSRDSKTYEALYGVVLGNNLFTAVGYNGSISTSPDGINWTGANVGISNYSITYGKGYFVTSSGFTSADGINWIQRDLGIGNGMIYYDVTFGNNTFVIVGPEFFATIIQSDPLLP